MRCWTSFARSAHAYFDDRLSGLVRHAIGHEQYYRFFIEPHEFAGARGT
jgi:hypothetical protein